MVRTFGFASFFVSVIVLLAASVRADLLPNELPEGRELSRRGKAVAVAARLPLGPFVREGRWAFLTLTIHAPGLGGALVPSITVREGDETRVFTSAGSAAGTFELFFTPAGPVSEPLVEVRAAPGGELVFRSGLGRLIKYAGPMLRSKRTEPLVLAVGWRGPEPPLKGLLTGGPSPDEGGEMILSVAGVGDLPSRPEPYDAFDLVVLGGEVRPGALGESRRAALRRYLRGGGRVLFAYIEALRALGEDLVELPPGRDNGGVMSHRVPVIEFTSGRGRGVLLARESGSALPDRLLGPLGEAVVRLLDTGGDGAGPPGAQDLRLPEALLASRPFERAASRQVAVAVVFALLCAASAAVLARLRRPLALGALSGAALLFVLIAALSGPRDGAVLAASVRLPLGSQDTPYNYQESAVAAWAASEGSRLDLTFRGGLPDVLQGARRLLFRFGRNDVRLEVEPSETSPCLLLCRSVTEAAPAEGELRGRGEELPAPASRLHERLLRRLVPARSRVRLTWTPGLPEGISIGELELAPGSGTIHVARETDGGTR